MKIEVLCVLRDVPRGWETGPIGGPILREEWVRARILQAKVQNANIRLAAPYNETLHTILSLVDEGIISNRDVLVYDEVVGRPLKISEDGYIPSTCLYRHILDNLNAYLKERKKAGRRLR